MPNLFRAFGSSVRGIDNSRQLALGVAIGTLIGILPKDNLLFFALLVILILSGANLVTGAVSAFGSSLLSSNLQDLFHQVGQTVFGWEPIMAPLTKFLQLPYAAWTRLDNSIVLGALTIGLTIALPIYLISFVLFQKYREPLERLVTDSRISTWVVGYSQAENEHQTI